MDGVGPRQERPGRHDLAWNAVDSNRLELMNLSNSAEN